MAEWVQKGSLKGPQGDPGQDAQLPSGGTTGQVLTKTADGEAWQDAPEPDMTGVVKVNDGDFLETGGQRVSQISVSGVNNAQTTIGSAASGIANVTAMGETQAQLIASVGNNTIGVVANSEATVFKFGSKSVYSITDDASTGDTDALATAKAVKDYVDDHAMPSVVPISQGGTGATTAEGARTALGIPDIEVATDEEFDSYMGLS